MKTNRECVVLGLEFVICKQCGNRIGITPERNNWFDLLGHECPKCGHITGEPVENPYDTDADVEVL